jgi:poly(A) polymerase
VNGPTGPAPETTRPLAAAWLADARLIRLFAALGRDGDAAWVVGGAVRNTLMRLPIADIDLATTARPETVMERARAARLKPVPTGVAHGTVTVVVDGTPFEVTTLRADVATDGRRAAVAFGRDWSTDAHRRDFTVNALYVSPDGLVHDFVGGIADCAARRIRFIGDADRRIAEDYLRILRFFRFHAAYGAGPPDPDGLIACAAAADKLARLSAERVGQEMKKLVVARRAAETVALMAETGILARVVNPAGGPAATPDRFAAVAALLGDAASADAPLLLAALAPDPARLAAALRLSGAEAARMATAVAAAPAAARAATAADIRRLAYDVGRAGARDALLLAAADTGRADDLAARLEIAAAFDPGPPPLRGRDLTPYGVRGPAVGELVRRAESLWRDSDFSLDRAALLAALGLPPTP